MDIELKSKKKVTIKDLTPRDKAVIKGYAYKASVEKEYSFLCDIDIALFATGLSTEDELHSKYDNKDIVEISLEAYKSCYLPEEQKKS